MNICHLVTAPESADLLLGMELEYLTSKGHTVTVVTGPGDVSYIDNLQGRGVRVFVLDSLTRSMSPRRDLAAAFALWNHFRSTEYDLLHTHMPKTGLFGRIIGRFAGLQIINTCHGYYFRQPAPLWERCISVVLEASAGRFSHVELFQNSDDLKIGRFLGLGRKSKLVGNGIDIRKWRFSEESRAAFRSDLGIGRETIVVAGVGRLIDHKGIREFKDAAEQLSISSPGQFAFLWVGPSEAAKSRSADFRESSRVQWLGQRTDMTAVYSGIDIFCLPSYAEGLPRSAMEAAATGLPLVLSDIPGSRDLALSLENVRLVPTRNSTELAKAIKATSPRRRMPPQAFTQKHDQGEIASQLEQIYASTMSA